MRNRYLDPGMCLFMKLFPTPRLFESDSLAFDTGFRTTEPSILFESRVAMFSLERGRPIRMFVGHRGFCVLPATRNDLVAKGAYE